MIFFPAIDLKHGQCVRLQRGEMDSAQVFNTDPAAQARAFADAGCRWLHIVDLDGAFAGSPRNAEAVDDILEAIDIPAQLGGGIRDLPTIEAWLDKGVRRVILGTAAVRDPELVRRACAAYPGRIAVGIDARNGYAATDGWAETTDVLALDLAKRFEDFGVAAIIHTDIARDGVLTGPNVEGTLALARSVRTPVIASGGVSSMDDLNTLKDVGQGLLEGVISGRAIYDGRIDPRAAAALLADHTADIKTEPC
ncbi:MAG: 1-(5-phosphoribosyl)-5-[(5-phosphoribosylamino)methylideneamino]imidazole-4-carboxamide isomerase [Hyphomicrobiales bacterium]|nr:1-(5-phosphoribosyl)-5-[(5-phosphoribosylamino)methylideneamino]imidazole-4-carboxamide isomerase [Hyphomicrobiales bacterium]